MVVTRESLRLKKRKTTNSNVRGSNVTNNFDNTKPKLKVLETGKQEKQLKNENTKKRKSSNIEGKVENSSKKTKISKLRNSKKEKLIEPILIISDNESNNESEIIDIENISESENDSSKVYNLRKGNPFSKKEQNSENTQEEDTDIVIEDFSDSDFEMIIDKEERKENKKKSKTNSKNKTKKSKNTISKNKEKNNSKKKVDKKKEDKNNKDKIDKDTFMDNNQDIEIDNYNELSISESLTMEDNLSEESENDEEWEEVEVSTKSDISSSEKLLKDKKSITISIDESKFKKEKKRGIVKQERDFRKALHKAEFIIFIISCRKWNTWCNSDILKVSNK